MLKLYQATVTSHFLMGTAGYPSPVSLTDAIVASGTEIVTVSLRRQNPELETSNPFWELVRASGARVLPNTAGCRSVREAVTTAHLARELFKTSWIKLEVIGNETTLAPDPFGLVEAAQILAREGFKIFPYTTTDLIVGDKLLEAGCRVLMPWGSPIGSGRGLADIPAMETYRDRFRDIPLIVDAGIGRPSDAAQAMELGYDGVLVNTAVAKSAEPAVMARAFAQAISAGRLAFESGIISRRQNAIPSTPVLGTPFWQVQ